MMNRFVAAWKRRREAGEVKSFKKNQKAEEAIDRRDLGIRSVPVGKIVGSVGRYQDFDGKFRLKKGRPPERLQYVKKAIYERKILPPVELYKIKDEYYVLDGNHRVAAAKEFGWTEINAHIIEYLPSKNTLENILYREKAHFEMETGIYDSIKLTEVGQYAYLLRQIAEHRISLKQITGAPVSLKSAARDWNKTIYNPFAAIIERSKLGDAFPHRTLADFYAYITFHQWQKGRKRKYGIGLVELIPKSMEQFRAKVMESKELEFPEMKRVTTAFLMISIKAGRDDLIMEKLFTYREVQEIYSIPGDFDIMVKIAVEQDWLSSDSETIGQFLHERVRSIPGVIKTQTIIPISSKQKKNPGLYG